MGPYPGVVNTLVPKLGAAVVNESNSGDTCNPLRDCVDQTVVNKTTPTRSVGIVLPPEVTLVEVDHVHKKRALDLFTGTGSVRKVLESAGWEVTSLDESPRWHATIQQDILSWDFRRLPPKSFDLITASPPMHRVQSSPDDSRGTACKYA